MSYWGAAIRWGEDSQRWFLWQAWPSGISFGGPKAEVLAAESGLPTSVRFDVPPRSCVFVLEQRRLVGRPLPAPGESFSIRYEKGPTEL